MIVATAGHVDHGKTELVRALTGVDTDRLEEEKLRGLSIDIGFAYRILPTGRLLGFVDVPGHEKFIRNMLSGVAGIDLCLLVVAADDGVMAQTQEHLSILKLLGIKHYIVAVTKIDRVLRARVLEVCDEITELFNDSFNATYSINPVCSLTKEGIKPLEDALIKHANLPMGRETKKYFRMAIDRVFTLNGIGLIVTGIVFSGTLHKSNKLTISSNGSQVKVRGIRIHNKDVDSVEAGCRCALNIVGRKINETSVRRGSWLIHSNLYNPTCRIDVALYVLKSEANALKHWTPTHFHIGSDHVPARVAILSGGKIAPGETGLVQLVLTRNICAVNGDRFVLRDQSAKRTIAGGRVIDPYSPKYGRRKSDRLKKLIIMSEKDPTHVIRNLVEQSDSGVPLSWFCQTFNLTEAQINILITSLDFQKIGKTPKEWIFNEKNWLKLQKNIETRIKAFHVSTPTVLGPTIENIQVYRKPFLDIEVLREALKILLAEKRVRAQNSRFYLYLNTTHADTHDHSVLSRLLTELAPISGNPPTLVKAYENIGGDVGIIEKAFKKGLELGDIILLDKNRYVAKKLIKKLKATVVDLALNSNSGSFTVADFRTETGLGRNFTIAVLEYFDQIGITVRENNFRRLCHIPE